METTRKDIIFIETTLNAPVEKVWRAWTEPHFVMQWFGSDPDGTVQSAKLDVQPGGTFAVTFSNSDGKEHTCYGVYRHVQPFSKLTFTWAWKAEPGVESFVTILLTPNGSATLMHFEHANVGYASAHNYAKGWRDTFEKLQRALAVIK